MATVSGLTRTRTSPSMADSEACGYW